MYICLCSLTACGIENKPEQSLSEEVRNENNENQQEQSPLKVIDYEMLGIKEYKYPSEFYMGNNLEIAITQLALNYENFNKDIVDSREWKEIFVAKLPQQGRGEFLKAGVLADYFHKLFSVCRGFQRFRKFALQVI